VYVPVIGHPTVTTLYREVDTAPDRALGGVRPGDEHEPADAGAEVGAGVDHHA
jgi:hypothetical protein